MATAAARAAQQAVLAPAAHDKPEAPASTATAPLAAATGGGGAGGGGGGVGAGIGDGKLLDLGMRCDSRESLEVAYHTTMAKISSDAL